MWITTEKNVEKIILFLWAIHNSVHLKFFFNDIVLLIKRNNGDIEANSNKRNGTLTRMQLLEISRLED